MKVGRGVTLKHCRPNLDFVRVVSRTVILAARALLNFYLLAIFHDFFFVRIVADLQSVHLRTASFAKIDAVKAIRNLRTKGKFGLS